MKEALEDLDLSKVILSSIADGVFTSSSARIIACLNRAVEKITGHKINID